MKFGFLITALLIITQLAQAAPATVNNVLNVGGITSQGLQNTVIPPSSVDGTGTGGSFVTLGGGVASATGSTYYGLYASSAQPYLVPAGKIFYATSLLFFSSTANSSGRLGWGSGPVASEGASAPAGSTSLFGNSNLSSLWLQSGPTANVWMNYSATGITFPASSYPYFFAGQSVGYQVLIQGIVK